MSNYRRGYLIELRCMQDLKKQGYTVLRMAGSHGPVDIVAFDNRHGLLIQVKRHKEHRTYVKEIAKLQRVKCPPGFAKALWVWQDKKGWIDKGVVI